MQRRDFIGIGRGGSDLSSTLSRLAAGFVFCLEDGREDSIGILGER